ncbi:MAG TPA: hypothetical protein PKE30_06100 [Niabella sp.]|nr:hypothetical protein [Niabella sp.]
MQSAKIHLSPQHIKLVTNAEWILTKNEILGHIKSVFEDLYKEQLPLVQSSLLPDEVLRSGSKISRGENYLGLPWIVLDHPRHFIKGNIFAIRTLFWWGRFFSTALHISGHWQQWAAPKLAAAFSSLQNNNLHICCNGDEWVHDVTSTSYLPVTAMTQKEFEKILAEAPFVKIAAHTNINYIENAVEILMKQFGFLTEILKESA